MEERGTNLVDKERQETDYNVYFLTQMYLSTKLIPIIKEVQRYFFYDC